MREDPYCSFSQRLQNFDYPQGNRLTRNSRSLGSDKREISSLKMKREYLSTQYRNQQRFADIRFKSPEKTSTHIKNIIKIQQYKRRRFIGSEPRKLDYPAGDLLISSMPIIKKRVEPLYSQFSATRNNQESIHSSVKHLPSSPSSVYLVEPETKQIPQRKKPRKKTLLSKIPSFETQTGPDTPQGSQNLFDSLTPEESNNGMFPGKYFHCQIIRNPDRSVE